MHLARTTYNLPCLLTATHHIKGGFAGQRLLELTHEDRRIASLPASLHQRRERQTEELFDTAHDAQGPQDGSTVYLKVSPNCTLACCSLYHIASAFSSASNVVLPPAPPAADTIIRRFE